MKVIITGSASGIGKHIFENFANNGHNCNGYDILDGKNLSESFVEEEIILDSCDADIFVNCAPFPGQTNLLKKIHSLWHNQNKVIVNLSSAVTYFYSDTNYPENFADYYELKKEQNDYIKNLMGDRLPYIMNVRPGWVNTQLASNFEGFKISPMDLAEMVYYFITNKEKYQVLDIVVI